MGKIEFTPEEFEKAVMKEFKPVTLKQAIHNSYWKMRELIEKGDKHASTNTEK